MIKITENLWIGTSGDEKLMLKYVRRKIVDSVLVVAHDMTPTWGWQTGVEYMHVGLVDGPGNPLAVYHAAVLALAAMLRRGKVLVCCHDGGRSLAVAIMYLYLMGEGPSWDEQYERLHNSDKDEELPLPHDVHRDAFFLMDWGMLTRVIEGEV